MNRIHRYIIDHDRQHIIFVTDDESNRVELSVDIYMSIPWVPFIGASLGPKRVWWKGSRQPIVVNRTCIVSRPSGYGCYCYCTALTKKLWSWSTSAGRRGSESGSRRTASRGPKAIHHQFRPAPLVSDTSITMEALLVRIQKEALESHQALYF